MTEQIKPSILDCIGNTPLVRLPFFSSEMGVDILAKCEFMNPCGSVKDRAALGMIESAERSGVLTKDSVVIEPTSGNTGIALAFVAAVKGYKVIIVMPDSMSLERRELLKAYGIRLELTPGHLQMDGAIKMAESLAKQYSKSFIPHQFMNQANPTQHFETTGPEIWRDTNGELDAFVAGVGTGGTISGVSRFLKSKNSDILTVAVEPSDSPVISGGKPGPHMIQGIGAGFVPENYDTKVVDVVKTVSNEEAMYMTRRLAKEEGLLCGISSGANLAAAMSLAKQPDFKGKRIVLILCDVGERYLSTTLFKGMNEGESA